MDERTLRPEELQETTTLSAEPQIHDDSVEYNYPVLEKWKIVKDISGKYHAKLFVVENAEGIKGVLKLYELGFAPSPSMLKAYQISKIEKRIQTVLEYGQYDNRHYVITAYLSDGSLEEGIISSNELICIIIPQLLHAINALHKNLLLHNDIKPSNIFWLKKGKEIVLGDFDTVSSINKESNNTFIGTKEYMAPEVLNAGKHAQTTASDICSLGLTLISLLQGYSPLSGKTDVQIRRAWMRGRLIPDTIDPQIKVLINGMIQVLPDARLNYDGIKRWLHSYKIEIDDETLNDQENTKDLQHNKSIRIANNLVYSIEEFINTAGNNWALSCFLLKQKQFNIFLRQFNPAYYNLCCECERIFDGNEALFRLLHTLSKTQDFFWYGEYYSNLEDFVKKMTDTEDTEKKNQGAHFLRANLLNVYLTNLDASNEKIEFAASLACVAKNHPDLALTQLLTAMSSVPEFQWKGQTFYSLDQLINWLMNMDCDLDGYIKELYESKKFEAWLTFINQGNFLNQVKKAMKAVII